MINGKVNVQRVESMVDRRFPGSKAYVSSAITKCGSTGIDPNNLATDYHTSTFFPMLVWNAERTNIDAGFGFYALLQMIQCAADKTQVDYFHKNYAHSDMVLVQTIKFMIGIVINRTLLVQF